jgi:hypothetical protein
VLNGSFAVTENLEETLNGQMDEEIENEGEDIREHEPERADSGITEESAERTEKRHAHNIDESLESAGIMRPE